MTLEELQKKLKEEANEELQKTLGNKDAYLLAYAKKFAFYNEVINFFDEMDENDFNEDWATDFESIKNERILRRAFEFWWFVLGGEDYNPFANIGLTEILGNWIYDAQNQ